MNSNITHVVVDVWGSLACFTDPACKVERMTYPIITPSAARGILCSIYFKPVEFYYEIEKIEVINDIKYINVMKNELKEKISVRDPRPICTRDPSREKGRTQRNTYYLKDVYYRIYAKIIKRNDCRVNIASLYEQFQRRVRKGQCFRQPYLGLRECVCHFSEPDYTKRPNDNVNVNVENMLYDVFDITRNIPLNTQFGNFESRNISFFHAIVKSGVCDVPSFFSKEIRRAKYVEAHI